MSSDKPYRYDLDITGKSLDNLVEGDPITLNDKPLRIAKFRYGPVFVDSIILYDKATQTPLIKGEHYRIPWLNHEASLMCAQEIVDSILITDSSVSANLTASYQTLGGSTMPLSQEIMTAYEIIINDNRSVDYVTGVFGKPNEFPPSAHPTFFADIYGWQSLAFQFERLTQAILMGNTPAYEALIQAIKSMAATRVQMETGEDVTKFVNVDDLLYVRKLYNFNTMKLTPEVTEVQEGVGKGVWFTVESSYAEQQRTYYWVVRDGTTNSDDFVTRTGTVTMVEGKGRFYVQLDENTYPEEREMFQVSLHLASPYGVEVIRSTPVYIRRERESNMSYEQVSLHERWGSAMVASSYMGKAYMHKVSSAKLTMQN